MSIKQLNVTYVAEEDRVLFRLTTQPADEYRLWLTRARVVDILNLGEQSAIRQLQAEHLQPQQQAKAIAEFKQQVVQHSSKFTEFEPESRFPLGEQPLLVHAVAVEQEAKLHVLHLTLSNRTTFTLRLNDDLLGKLRLLLTTIANKVDWAIPVGSPAALGHDGVVSIKSHSESGGSEADTSEPPHGTTKKPVFH